MKRLPDGKRMSPVVPDLEEAEGVWMTELARKAYPRF
jgi:hypothetical protein